MAKFLTLAQLQKEFGITMRSLRELMQREIYEPVKSIADQAKSIADSVRRDADEGKFKGDTGADGEPGRDGTDGAPGQDGEDGYSPTISVQDITGGHRVTITDAEGDHVFDVMDGQGGGEGAVSSVNGKTGTVVLDAEDVGARADTWMPTAVEVGALPEDTQIPTALSDLSGDATHRTVTDAEKATWSGKQDAISDLATIRSEAANGQTAYELLDGVETLLAGI